MHKELIGKSNNMTYLKPGDLVVITGHKTLMTVVQTAPDVTLCAWFDEFEKFHKCEFFTYSLELLTNK